MGLGPSIMPTCRSKQCDNHQDVIYHLDMVIPQDSPLYKRLEPWWIQTTLRTGKSLYWACESCYHKINKQDLSLFSLGIKYYNGN